MKKTKSFSLDATCTGYLDTIIIKSKNVTINELIKKFREQGLQIDFNRKLNDLEQPTTANLDIENVDFITTKKIGGWGFTLNCLILTAKELNLQL